MTIRILAVHQGYELYGSDRSFLQSLAAMKSRLDDAWIKAVIPASGPLRKPLEEVANRVAIEPLWVPRKNSLLRLFTWDLLRLPFRIVSAIRHIRAYDLLYINTMMPFDYMIAARFAGRPAILHAREIASGTTGKIFAAVVRFSRAHVVANSQATLDALPLASGQTGEVIHNGVPAPASASPLSPSLPLHLLLIGRFNSWKGQDLAVEAVALLPEEIRRKIHLRLLGGVFEQQYHFKQDVERLIVKHQLADTVSMHDFEPDPAPHYDWSHVVLVPSRTPEPFGRVAIEGMAFGRPVIASAQGGLAEIVEDRETGWLVTPNDAQSLADAIRDAVEHPEHVTAYGSASLARYEAKFSEDGYARRIAATCEHLSGKHGLETYNTPRREAA